MIAKTFFSKHVQSSPGYRRQNLHHEVFEHSRDAILLLGSRGFIDCNQAALDLFGLDSIDELISKDPCDFAPEKQPDGEDSREIASRHVGKALQDGTNFFTWTHCRKDGTPFLAEVLLSRIQFEDETIVRGTVRDVTAREKYKADLNRKRAELNGVINTTHDGILAVDLHGRVIVANRRFAEMWHIPQPQAGSVDETLLMSVMIQVMDPEAFLKKVRKLYDSIENDVDMLHLKDGQVFARKSSPLIIDGIMVGRLWSFNDITNYKRAEDEIKLKNEELTVLNKTKDKFFSIIAHDLRAPFNTLLGLTSLLSDELSDLTPTQIREYVDSLKNSANNAYCLMEGLLDWSRMQQGAVSCNPEPIDLEPLIEQSIIIALEQATAKNIQITYELNSGITVYADLNMLKFIIRNLLNNAIKFTPDMGNIVIEGRIVDDDNVEISVRDNGIGMSRSIAADLFQIDKQVSRRGTNSETGSGLGLVLCKEFVDKLNGKIWVESEENKGTTFFISIPSHENTDKAV